MTGDSNLNADDIGSPPRKTMGGRTSLGWSRRTTIHARKKPISTMIAFAANLSVLERALNLQSRIDLMKVTQVARPGGKQPHDKGIGRAADQLGLNRDEVRRLLQIANISPKAQSLAIKLGLDHNQSALIEISEQPTANKQIAKAREIAQRKAEAPSKKRNAAAKSRASTKTSSETSSVSEVIEGPPTAPDGDWEEDEEDEARPELEMDQPTSPTEPLSPDHGDQAATGDDSEAGIPLFWTAVRKIRSSTPHSPSSAKKSNRCSTPVPWSPSVGSLRSRALSIPFRASRSGRRRCRVPDGEPEPQGTVTAPNRNGLGRR